MKKKMWNRVRTVVQRLQRQLLKWHYHQYCKRQKGRLQGCLFLERSGLPLFHYPTEFSPDHKTVFADYDLSLAGFLSALHTFSDQMLFPGDKLQEIVYRDHLLLCDYFQHDQVMLVVVLALDQPPYINGYELLKNLRRRLGRQGNQMTKKILNLAEVRADLAQQLDLARLGEGFHEEAVPIEIGL